MCHLRDRRAMDAGRRRQIMGGRQSRAAFISLSSEHRVAATTAAGGEHEQSATRCGTHTGLASDVQKEACHRLQNLGRRAAARRPELLRSLCAIRFIAPLAGKWDPCRHVVAPESDNCIV